jgi:hypothetical protein
MIERGKPKWWISDKTYVGNQRESWANFALAALAERGPSTWHPTAR